MKHLKTYEMNSINYIPDNVLRDLQDICLELTDMGLTVWFNPRLNISKSESNINIVKYPTEPQMIGWFKYTYEIEEVFERIKDYMLSNGFNTNIHNCNNAKLKIGVHFYDIHIDFTKK